MVKRFVGIVTAMLLACLCQPYTISAQTDAILSIGQVSVNKPEVKVYFNLSKEAEAETEEAKSDEPDVTARLADEVLTINTLESFAESGEGIWYLMAVDCSTSIRERHVEAMRSVMLDLVETMGEQDRLTLITFGKTVEIPLHLSNDKEEIGRAAAGLRADQNGTLFYDAIMKALDLGEQYGDGIPERRAVLVFSDAEDYNVGGYLIQEVEERLSTTSFPLYAFGFDHGPKGALDAFGAMARRTVGAIDIVTNTTLLPTVKRRIENLNAGYIAHFNTKTNIIGGENEKLLLTVTMDGTTFNAETSLMPARWIHDFTPPQLLTAEQTASNTILIQFNKPVLNADKPGSFRLEDAEGNLLALKAVSYNDMENAATVTLNEMPVSGMFTISGPGITDATMEKNPLSSSVAFNFIGTEPVTPAPVPTQEPNNPEPEASSADDSINIAVWIFVAIVLGQVIVYISLRISKSRKKTVAPSVINIRIIDVAQSVQDMAIPIQSSLFVGRGTGNDLVFNDARMSRQHFAISVNRDEFLIQNLSETGGTFLNGVRLTAPRPLKDGDKISAGNMIFVILPKE